MAFLAFPALWGWNYCWFLCRYGKYCNYLPGYQGSAPPASIINWICTPIDRSTCTTGNNAATMQTNTECVEMKSENSCHPIFLKSQIAGAGFKHIQLEFVCRITYSDQWSSWFLNRSLRRLWNIMCSAQVSFALQGVPHLWPVCAVLDSYLCTSTVCKAIKETK